MRRYGTLPVIRVDVLTLLAPGEVMRSAALEALDRQGFVRVRHLIHEGRARPGESRVQTIARARNEIKVQGDAHFAMFLDRDVVLPPHGIERLAFALSRPGPYAALGINYQEPRPAPAAHVAMGAVLFVRPILARLRFRAEPGRCECSCCCEDLRRMGYEIDYLPGVRAEHAKSAPPWTESAVP